jgi:hypothetical protein
MANERLAIGELSRRTGLPVKTLRFYSDAGLLPPAERSQAVTGSTGTRRWFGSTSFERCAKQAWAWIPSKRWCAAKRRSRMHFGSVSLTE